MAHDFYDKLSDLALLRRAWHLARNDSRTDFIFDPYRFSDFAFYLDDHLNGISHNLKSGSYYPKPLQTIDIPKSSLSVRPGSALCIEDKIIMFAIACVVAPHLDKKLPDTVYSWRLKKGQSKKELFEDHEILKYPFLRRTTIQRRLNFVEPWYGVWPRFIKELEAAYETDGYNFMVESDIVAYFENIDLGLLRDLLLHYLPKQPRVINFMIGLLEYWSWPAIHGGLSTRGIPQGNGVSSFIGNIYLLPLDKAFQRFCKIRDIKYLRYMDDVKVMAKDIRVARDALFLMNEKLRELHLNIQGAKTRILQYQEIRNELFDERLDKVNEVIAEIKKKRSLTNTERSTFVDLLKIELKKVKGRKGIIRDKELRLFRRLITGFTLLRHSGMVRIVLDQLERNPDFRLLNSAARYLRSQVKNIKSISDKISTFLMEDQLLFQYQEAHCLMALRYQRDVTSGMWKEAKNRLRSKREHWYVRQQAALLISQKDLSNKELKSLRDLADKENNAEVKRALVQVLAQLPQKDLEAFTKQLLFESDPKCQRLGTYYYGLLFEKDRGKEQLDYLFNNFQEDILVDRLYQMEVLSKAKNQEIHTILLSKLRKVSKSIQRPILRKRIELMIVRIKQELERRP
jgi:hypothetical protein